MSNAENQPTRHGPKGWLEKGPSASLFVRYVSQRICSSLTPRIQTLLKPTVCLLLMTRCTSLGWSSHARNPSHQRICRPKDPRIEDRITVIYTSEKMALRFRRRPRFILVEYPSQKRTGCGCGCGCFLVPCLLFFLFLLHCAEWLAKKLLSRL